MGSLSPFLQVDNVDGSFHLIPATINDAGTYTCTARNSAGERSAAAVLTVDPGSLVVNQFLTA